MVSGISFSRGEIVGVPLDLGGPRRAALVGHPVESFGRLYQDIGVRAGIWECTPGVFPVEKRGQASIMYVLDGAGVVRDARGGEHVIEPGAVIVEPDGFKGEWQVDSTVRKFYVILDRSP